jgi:hypothetical protein
MKAILFGATGRVGQGVLRECLLDPTIDRSVSQSGYPKCVLETRDINHARLPS